MADSFNIAPGVRFTERDASLATRSALTQAAGFVGRFLWGPVEEVVSITSGETELVNIFGKPSITASGIDQLVLHDYFRYANSAQVCRAFQVGATNAVRTGETAPTIKNYNELTEYTGTLVEFARYVGSLGNNIGVLTIDEALRAQMRSDYIAGFRNGLTSLWPTITDKGALSATERHVLVTDVTGAISGTAGEAAVSHKTLTTDLEAAAPADNAYTLRLGTSATFPIDLVWDDTGTAPADIDAFLDRAVELFALVSATEKQRNGIRAIKRSGAGELTVEFMGAVPADGTWYADPNTSLTAITEAEVTVETVGILLEPFERISTAEGSKNASTGLPNYFKDTVNLNSRYIGLGQWVGAAGFQRLQGGSDGSETNIDYFTSQQSLRDGNVRFLGYIDVAKSVGDSQTAIDLAVQRRDCVTFVAPTIELRSRTSATAKFSYLQQWRDSLLRDNSYFFMTDNWGEVYDQYNNMWRYIPTSGGTCGLWFRSIAKVGAGKSPAFLNRGGYLNYRKLDWSADDDQVAVLYNDFQINSVREMEEGIILWGDRTGLSKESSFNRIGTRGIFIDAEIAIAKTAKFTLGEDNDVFTRRAFDNAVRPFLRNKVERGEIDDFFVKTDETNNTAQVVVSNQFVSGIYIKPKYSINFIFLEFVSVRPDVSFSEVETSISSS